MVEHVLAVLPADVFVYVHAQKSAVGFWARQGFVVEGAAFVEADIVHCRMVRRPRL